MNQIILKHTSPPQETFRSCKNYCWHADEVSVILLPRSTSILKRCLEGRELWIYPQSGFWRAPSFVIGENCALIFSNTRTNLKLLQLWPLIFCQGCSFRKIYAPPPKQKKVWRHFRTKKWNYFDGLLWIEAVLPEALAGNGPRCRSKPLKWDLVVRIVEEGDEYDCGNQIVG